MRVIHRGEAEAIAIARELNADWFLTDDNAARPLAGSIGIEVHGSLAVVLEAARVGTLDRAAASLALAALQASSLWVSARVFEGAEATLAMIWDSED
jgi:predicted nucleic acid-binding protein